MKSKKSHKDSYRNILDLNRSITALELLQNIELQQLTKLKYKRKNKGAQSSSTKSPY